jgi:C_GCAxxG_C_C family probable redox protein
METTKSQLAQNAFRRGCNCAQAVLSVFSPSLGLSADQAMRLACGFDGGMRMGETCGAVTGAIMVLGLRHGNRCTGDLAGKQATYQFVPVFMRQFSERHGSCCCRELLGCDPSAPEGYAQARDTGLFVSHCQRYVGTAVEILEQMTPAFSVADV